MAVYLRAVAGFFGAIVSFPFLFGFIGAWQEGVGFALIVFGMPLVLLGALSGAIFWLIRGIQHARAAPGMWRRIASVAVAPTMLVVAVALSLILIGIGNFVGTVSRLAINQSRYERIIAKARAHGPKAWAGEEEGVSFTTDVGPPLRVAFNPAGMLDNWSGIIYDPTGDVMLAKGFDAKGRFYAPERITKLFGGDLVGCRHLWGAYYDCSFT